MTSLRDVTGATSIAEVVRRALAVYEYAIKCQESGERLVIEGEDGSRKEIIVV